MSAAPLNQTWPIPGAYACPNCGVTRYPATLVQFEDRDDDELMPMRTLFGAIAEACNVRDFDGGDIPEWESMVWLRERARAALTSLAEGERIP